MKKLLKGGRVIDPANRVDGRFDVLIEDGRIAGLLKPEEGEALAGDFRILVVNAEGCLVTPGFVDLHTHLRDPGYEHKETIRTGTEAAAAGGFTTVVCMANTNPVNDCQPVTEYILTKAEKEGKVKVKAVGALTKGLKGEVLAEIGELKEAGVVALSDDGHPVMNAELARRGFEYASMFSLPVIVHSEDLNLSAGGCMNEGYVATELGLPPMPHAAEEVMVARDLILAKSTGCRVHIAHVSTAGSVDLIRWAKDQGVPVTAEAAPHHFSLNDEAVRSYCTNFKEDRLAVVKGLADGIIDAIATDHAPHETVVKELEFDKAANGVIGLETALPMALKLVETGDLGLFRMVETLTSGPAEVLGLSCGTLSVGSDADVVVIDPRIEYIYEAAMIKSRSKNSPFLGWTLKGKAVYVLVKGEAVVS